MAYWSVTRAEIAGLLKSRLENEEFTASTYFTSAEFQRWLNLAMEEVADECMFEEVDETDDLVASQSEYALPADILVITDLQCKDSAGNWYPLHVLSWQEKEAIVGHDSTTQAAATTSAPSKAVIFNGKIKLFDAPNYTTTGNTGLRIRGRGRPATMTLSADVCTLQAPYTSAVIERMCVEAYLKLQDLEKAGYYDGRFERAKLRIKQSLERLRSTKQRVMRDVEFSGTYPEVDETGEQR